MPSSRRSSSAHPITRLGDVSSTLSARLRHAWCEGGERTGHTKGRHARWRRGQPGWHRVRWRSQEQSQRTGARRPASRSAGGAGATPWSWGRPRWSRRHPAMHMASGHTRTCARWSRRASCTLCPRPHTSPWGGGRARPPRRRRRRPGRQTPPAPPTPRRPHRRQCAPWAPRACQRGPRGAGAAPPAPLRAHRQGPRGRGPRPCPAAPSRAPRRRPPGTPRRAAPGACPGASPGARPPRAATSPARGATHREALVRGAPPTAVLSLTPLPRRDKPGCTVALRRWSRARHSHAPFP